MIIDIIQLKDQQKLEISYITDTGDTDIILYDIPTEEMFEWQESKTNIGYKSWNDLYLKKKKSDYLNKYRIYEVLWKMDNDLKNKIFSYNYPKIAYIDIETWMNEDSNIPFKQWVEMANTPITTISVVIDNKSFVLGTKDLSLDEEQKIESEINSMVGHIKTFKFKYIKFKTEYDLLYYFLKNITHKATVLTGWNFTEFDWTYIVNRCKKIGLDPSIASPTMKIHGSYSSYSPHHKLIIDYAAIFAKWDRSIEVKDNNTLDFVANSILGTHKVKYPDTLNNTYLNNFYIYVLYNVMDSILVNLIDFKRNTLTIMLTISYLSKIPINKALNPTIITEALLSFQYFQNEKYIIPNKHKNIKQSYEGAFVKDPVKGIHEHILCMDFASLYPSIMRTFNISPESYIGNTNNVDKEREDKEKITTFSGAMYKDYKKHGDSDLKQIITDIYAKRKEYKKKYQESESNIEKIQEILKNKYKKIV